MSQNTEYTVDPSRLVSPDAAPADAAEEGSEATKGMIATIGKAKSLGERSLGYRDPGSISVAIMLASIADGVDAV